MPQPTVEHVKRHLASLIGDLLRASYGANLPDLEREAEKNGVSVHDFVAAAIVAKLLQKYLVIPFPPGFFPNEEE